LGKKCKWQEKLEEMERMERVFNEIFTGENSPSYEEDMDLDYWRRKKLVREKARK